MLLNQEHTFSFIKSKINEQINYAEKVIVEQQDINKLDLTKSEQILYEQIDVYLSKGEQLTEQIRDRLFKYLNSGAVCFDSRFPVSVVNMLRFRLSSRRQEVHRTLNMIEQLVANCGDVMNQAFNTAQFCKALSDIALYKKYISLNYDEWDVIRKKAASIFLFWYKKYKDEAHHYIYVKQFLKLKENGQVEIPYEPFFEENKVKQNAQTTDQFASSLQDIEAMIIGSQNLADEAEKAFKFDKKKIDTEFVRALKLKNKALYNMGIDNSSSLNEEMKTRLNTVYKRIRGLLKKIDQWNDQKQKQKAMQEEQKYLEQKLKKLGQSKPATQTVNKGDLLGDEQILQRDQKRLTKELNLLDSEQIVKQSKNQNRSQQSDLLDVISAKQEQKQLDIKELYKKSSENQQLDGIDLIGNFQKEKNLGSNNTENNNIEKQTNIQEILL